MFIVFGMYNFATELNLLTQNSIQAKLGNWLLFVTDPSLVLSSNLKEYHHLSNDYEMSSRHTRHFYHFTAKCTRAQFWQR